MVVRSKRLLWVGMIPVLLSGVAVCAQTTSAPVAALPATQPAASAPATRAALDPAVDRILSQLERRDVHDFRSRLAWRQQYILDTDEDAVTKRGEIWYQKAEPVARFLIHFTEQISSARKDKLDEQHLFDGCWYTEIQSRTKSVQRREVRRPNDPGNPYKVGEGVFPLPFGQKKEDILREFDVSLVAPGAGDPPETDHLRLVPHAGTRTGESYKELDFWVSKTGPLEGLPIKVRVAKLDGTGKLNSHITITFDDVHLDEGFKPNIFEYKKPEGYTEEPAEYLKPAEAPREGTGQ